MYGDFDVDGVTATVLLVTALQAVGANVGKYIPDRVDEGYGLNKDAIARIAPKATLLITVDCGIRSVDEVAFARQLGMDVIVTDHHTLGPVLPVGAGGDQPAPCRLPQQIRWAGRRRCGIPAGAGRAAQHSANDR